MTTPSSSPVKILIVEDELIFRSLLKSHIESEYGPCMVYEACDGEEGWQMFREHQPDYCIIDLGLPKLRGEMLINLMHGHHSQPRILVLTGHTPCELRDILHKTDDTFLVEKMAPFHQLNGALKVLLNRNTDVAHHYLVRNLTRMGKSAIETLTNREKTILSMLGEGKTSDGIAEFLGISVHTVRTHRKNLMKKLGIHNHGVLVRFAIEQGLSAKRS